MQQNTADSIAKSAWETTKTYWKEFIAFPIAVSIGLFLVMGLLTQVNSGVMVILQFLLMISFIVFIVTFSTAVTKWCSEIYNGKKEIDIEDGLRYGLSRFWGVLGTSLLTTIKVTLWTYLLIIPGYYKGVMYMKSVKVSQLEKISGGDANRISQHLVRSSGFMRTMGNFMSVAIVAILFFLIYAGLSIGVGFGFTLVSEPLGFFIMVVLVVVGEMALLTFMNVFQTYEYLIYREENKASLTPFIKALSSMK